MMVSIIILILSQCTSLFLFDLVTLCQSGDYPWHNLTTLLRLESSIIFLWLLAEIDSFRLKRPGLQEISNTPLKLLSALDFPIEQLRMKLKEFATLERLE